MDLFAWLTLANGDETGFVRADAQAVAGRVQREPDGSSEPRAPRLRLRCWPQGTTTSDLREFQPPPPAPPPSLEIAVTGSRVARANLESASPVTVVMAEQLELGDLKLYRIPEPVTVAAKSQKQVALLRHERVPVDIVYRYRSWRGAVFATLITRNRREEGLGVPLPAGQVAFFQTSGGRRVLVGRGTLADRTVGEDVEIDIGASADVQTEIEEVERRQEEKAWILSYRLTVTNAKPRAVPFEAWIASPANQVAASSAKLITRDGAAIWRIRVPAKGRATLRYTLRQAR